MTPDIGVLFYRHTGTTEATVHVHAKRVGRIPYRNMVNVYRVKNGQDASKAKLTMCRISIRTTQSSFNLGEVKVNPGDALYAQSECKGLEFVAVVPHRPVVDPFADLFA